MVELDDCVPGFSPGVRTVFQSSASPRILKVPAAVGVPFPLLGNKKLPHLPDLKYSFPPTSAFLVLSPISPRFRVVFDYRVVEASATQSVSGGPPHGTCAHSTSFHAALP